MPTPSSESGECATPVGALPPHPPLLSYSRTGIHREVYVQGLFEEVAPEYERMEGFMALGSGSRYRKQALLRAGLAPGDTVLDVGTGTGLLAREALALAGPQGCVLGVDPSPGMLNEVREPRLQLLRGSAEALPLPDASCDFLSMGYALRHLRDVHAAFAEFYRVLCPGGRLLLLEITRPTSLWGRLLLRGHLRVVVPLLGRFAGCSQASKELWHYYHETIEACVPPPVILEALRASGFLDVQRHVEFRCLSEYMARRPGRTDHPKSLPAQEE
ncbi:class I SAM-dependent methyltransferase [Verrucomicrobium sp. 3C]|uniref:class I SAM-dependent methyltransferase n=1 Tax=Verrucomicrobium sp. 3C TaxID=1134055 RepID=UPI000375908B|nr:class I SAM-dependent methyltransferase [Verrucomicrobium sp. 3C]